MPPPLTRIETRQYWVDPQVLEFRPAARGSNQAAAPRGPVVRLVRATGVGAPVSGSAAAAIPLKRREKHK